VYKEAHGLHDIDFEKFLEEECNYLASLKKPRADDLMDMAYIKSLEALEAAVYMNSTYQPLHDSPVVPQDHL